jgi:hypothetical protein
MKYITEPDKITAAVCRWLLGGGEAGGYSGPVPGEGHDLSPLLADELSRGQQRLFSSALWFRLEQSVRPVLQLLDDAGLAVWAIKGFDLARSVYPFPWGRPMCDADLFLRAGDRQSVLELFAMSGWSRQSPGDGVFSSGIVSEMKMIRNGVMAELHTHIFYFPATFPGKLPADLFLNGRVLEPGLMGFAWHNALLLVLLHMLTNSAIRPVWWVDVCMLCRKVSDSSTWEQFTLNAAGTKLGGAIAEPLSIALKYFGAEIPEQVVATLTGCSSGREDILLKLNSRRKAPTLLNLRYLHGWKRIAWFNALLWLLATGQHPLRGKFD